MNIVGKWFVWGPLLMSYENIDNDIIKELNDRGKKLSKKWNANLAGHIKEEYKYETEDLKWFANKITPYFKSYLTSYYEWTKQEKNIKSISIESMWINYMKCGEFNPPHTHNNYDISFVIYTDVPKEIQYENIKYIGTSGGPGTIEFMLGQNLPNGFVGIHNFLPKTGDLFIFPSRLVHYVSPFKSDVIRKSVSGNCFFSN